MRASRYEKIKRLREKFKRRFRTVKLITCLALIAQSSLSLAKPLEEKVVTVDNLSPQTDLNYQEKKIPRAVDIFVNNDQSNLSYTQIRNYMNTNVAPKLAAQGIDYKITYNENPQQTSEVMLGITGNKLLLQNYKGEVFESASYYGKASNYYAIAGFGANGLNKVSGLSNLRYLGESANGYMVAIDSSGYPIYKKPDFNTVVKLNTTTSIVKVVGAGYGSGYDGDIDTSASIVMLDSNGAVYIQGADTAAGLLGLGGTLAKVSFPSKVPGLPKIVDVSASSSSVLAVAEDGSVWGWGLSYYGFLDGNYSNGNATYYKSPRKLAHLNTKMKKVSVGNGYAFYIDYNGDAWGSGYGSYQQPGYAGYLNAPAKKLDGIANVESISAGTNTVVFRTTDGRVYITGMTYDNSSGSDKYSAAPVLIGSYNSDSGEYSNGLKSVKAVSNGSLAVIVGVDGYLYASSENRAYARNTVLSTKKIFSGRYNQGVIETNGKAQVWGYGYYGLLQYNTNGSDGSGWTIKVDNNYTPLIDVVDAALTYNQGTAVTKDGSLYTWGVNTGNSNTSNYLARALPMLGKEFAGKVRGYPAMKSVFSDDDGDVHPTYFAVSTLGDLYSWGDNAYGRLGFSVDNNTSIARPIKVPGVANVKQVVSGRFHTLVLTNTGDVYSMGLKGRFLGREYANVTANGYDMPYTSTYSDYTPKLVTGLPKIIHVSATTMYSFAVDINGGIWVWGGPGTQYNTKIGLDNGLTLQTSAPTKITIPGATFKEVHASYDGAFALSTSGEVYAWGGDKQQLTGVRYGMYEGTSYIWTPTKVYTVDAANLPIVAMTVEGGGNAHRQFLNNAGQLIVNGTNSYLENGVGGDSGYSSWASRQIKDSSRAAALIMPPREPLDDVVAKASWRTGAVRYVVNVGDNMLHELENDVYVRNISSSMINNNISLVGMGTADNEPVYRGLINSLGSKGKFINYLDNNSTAFNRLGDYISNKIPLDLFINVGNTSHEKIDIIKKKVESIVRPVLENYSIEPMITIVDGNRVKENRMYYQDSANYLYEYDPLTGTDTKLFTYPVLWAVQAKDGNIYYHSDNFGSMKIYKYNTSTRTNTLYYEHPTREFDNPYAPGSKVPAPTYVIGFNIGFEGEIYLSERYDWWGYTTYSILKVDPVTKTFTTMENVGSPSSYNNPKIDYNGNPYFLGYYYENSSGVPSSMNPFIRNVQNDSFMSKNGCYHYITYVLAFGDVQPQNKGRCGADWPFGWIANRFYPAGPDSVVNAVGSYMNSPPGTYTINDKTGDVTQLFNFEAKILGVTDEGKMYYGGNPDGKRHIYDFNTGTDSVMTTGLTWYSKDIYRQPEMATRKLSTYTMEQAFAKRSTRAGSDAYFVELDDNILSELNDPVASYNIKQRLTLTQTTFVGMGRAANKSQIDALVAEQGFGTYIDNTDLDVALTQLATYLTTYAGVRKTKATGYVILDKDPSTGTWSSGKLEFTTGYSDKESDPLFDNRWLISHDPTYYENSLGAIANNNTIVTTPLSYITLPGRYEITYQARDNPVGGNNAFDEFRKWSIPESSKLIIYAHRRPIGQAALKVVPNGTVANVIITESSYDPDRQSQPNQGIATEVWKWKYAGDTDWTLGLPPSTVPLGQLIYVSLVVTDLDGAESAELLLSVNSDGNNNPPTAQFSATPTIAKLSDSIVFLDTSWDQDGDPIVERSWKVVKDSVAIYSGTTPPTANVLQTAAIANGLAIVGDYQVELRVKDNPSIGSPMWSNPSVSVITLINMPPSADVTNPSGTYDAPTVFNTRNPTIGWNQTDPDSATIFKGYRVNVYNESGVLVYDSLDQSQNTNSSTASYTVPTNLSEGKYQVFVRVSDGITWSSWSSVKWMEILLNRPPVSDFDWNPKPIYEGDAITLINKSTDPDGDILTSTWSISGPSGFSSTQYTNSASILGQNTESRYGNWNITLTVCDPNNSCDSVTKQINVGDLTMNASVNHTEQWNQNRQKYNLSKTNNSENPRPYDTFWAGESFELSATTNTNSASSVRVQMSYTALSSNLISNENQNWNGRMYRNDFDKLPDGDYVFTFIATWGNGHSETVSRTIRISGSRYDYTQNVRKE